MSDASRLENATIYSVQRKLWQSSKQDGAFVLLDIIPAGPPHSEGRSMWIRKTNVCDCELCCRKAVRSGAASMQAQCRAG